MDRDSFDIDTPLPHKLRRKHVFLKSLFLFLPKVLKCVEQLEKEMIDYACRNEKSWLPLWDSIILCTYSKVIVSAQWDYAFLDRSLFERMSTWCAKFHRNEINYLYIWKNYYYNCIIIIIVILIYIYYYNIISYILL